MSSHRSVFFLSDHTGITVETLGQSLLAQFPGFRFTRINLPYIDSIAKAKGAADHINRAAATDGETPIVFSTLPDPEVRALVADTEALFLDFLERFIGPLEQTLSTDSSHNAGKAHGSDNPEYLRRMDAVNFTLAHDDGVLSANLDEAEIILVGVSRSGKTPTCLYLSMQFGIRAANFPLTEEDLEELALPGTLESKRDRLFGLSIDPARIQQIRQERRPHSRYASLAQCRYEIKQAEQLMRTNDIPYLDSTHMSIEEIATKIIQERGLERHTY